MDGNMEKLMEKQMKWQKITAVLLAIRGRVCYD